MIGDSLFAPERLPECRLHLISSTQALLGDTIGLSDDEWQSPSGLPGWTRAHVASHLAQGANRLTALVGQLNPGGPPLAWPISQPDHDLEAESRRRAVVLQVALDTSASRLLAALERLTDEAWSHPLLTPAGPLPARAVAYVQLNEVVLHHLDLRLGLSLRDIDLSLVANLLLWNAQRLDGRMRHHRLHLVSDEGLDLIIGSGPQVTDIRGSSAGLLGWLSGRLDARSVLGADHIDLGGPI